MRNLAIISVWLGVLIVDGIIFPALTGLPSGFGIIVFLSALAITFDIHRWVIGLGIILAGLTELILGAYFGTIIGAWLVMAWGWHLINKFLNIKSLSENDSFVVLIPSILLGLGLFSLGESALWIIDRLGYESGLALTILVNIIQSPIIISIVITEFVVIFFIFRFLYTSKNSIYE